MSIMRVVVKRFADNGNATLSAFFIDGKFQCFGVEDEERENKLSGETRVLEGIYDLVLRSEGGFHERYKVKFADIHKGMICITNAPDYKIITPKMSFQYVLIHVGNTEKDTDACYLPNTSVDSNSFTGGGSVSAYKKIYPIIANHLAAGKKATIQYIDVEDNEI